MSINLNSNLICAASREGGLRIDENSENQNRQSVSIKDLGVENIVSTAAGSLLNQESNTSSTVVKDHSLSPRERLSIVGYAKNPKRFQEADDTDLIVRTVMRFPSDEAKQELYFLHNLIKTKLFEADFEGKVVSNAGLEWLMDFKWVKQSRGGFKDVAALCKFFQRDPKSFTSSRLILGLNAIMTAITYRLLNYSNIDGPCELNNPDQELVMTRFCKAHMGYFVSDIEASYPDSESCMETNYKKNKFYPKSARQEISDGSDIEDILPPPLPRMNYEFNKTQWDSINAPLTWVYSAHQGNIPVHSGISGTLTRLLAVIESLYGYEPRQLSKNTLELLAGAIIIPICVRGDYHTVAETGAAFYHFRETPDGGGAVLTPQQALKLGLELMTNAVSGEFRDDISSLSSGILKGTTDFDYFPYR